MFDTRLLDILSDSIYELDIDDEYGSFEDLEEISNYLCELSDAFSESLEFIINDLVVSEESIGSGIKKVLSKSMMILVVSIGAILSIIFKIISKLSSFLRKRSSTNRQTLSNMIKEERNNAIADKTVDMNEVVKKLKKISIKSPLIDDKTSKLIEFTINLLFGSKSSYLSSDKISLRQFIGVSTEAILDSISNLKPEDRNSVDEFFEILNEIFEHLRELAPTLVDEFREINVFSETKLHVHTIKTSMIEIDPKFIKDLKTITKPEVINVYEFFERLEIDIQKMKKFSKSYLYKEIITNNTEPLVKYIENFLRVYKEFLNRVKNKMEKNKDKVKNIAEAIIKQDTNTCVFNNDEYKILTSSLKYVDDSLKEVSKVFRIGILLNKHVFLMEKTVKYAINEGQKVYEDIALRS